jgi:putative endonuclease
MMPRSPAKSGTEFRQFNERAGRRGEFWAALYLRLKGYRILATRVRTKLGEIDLIARRGKALVFIEVKARAFSEGENDALFAVNRERIVRAAAFWLARHPALAETETRCDVIFLAPFQWPRHITGAFDATGLM